MNKSNLRIHLFILIFFSLSFGAFAQQEKISLEVFNEKIEDVLLQLAADYEYDIIFTASYFSEQRVSIQSKDESIQKILGRILKNTKVDFLVAGNTIVLTKRKRIYGYLIDKKSGEKLINAAIAHLESNSGAYTNEHGFFSFEMPFEQKEILASYVGYETQNVAVPTKNEVFLNIELVPEAHLSEVVVLSSQHSAKAASDFRKPTSEELLKNKVMTYVSTGGVPDVFQYLYKKPGVAAGPDGLGGLHVRGGNTDQNLILYDGVKVYNPGHSFGLYSIFNPTLLSHAKFSKANFHPRTGGRISSVLDMRLKEGSTRLWSGSAAVSNISTEVAFDGPIKKETTGFLVAFRRSHLDNFIKSYTRNSLSELYEDEFEYYEQEGESNIFFYDFNAKLHHRFSPNHRVFLSAYRGRDGYDDSYFQSEDIEGIYVIQDSLEYQLRWGNDIYSLRWNHLWNDRLFSNATLSFSKYKSNSDSFIESYTFEDLGNDFFEDWFTQIWIYNSSIADIGLDYDFDYFLSKKHHLTFGAGFHQVQYEPGSAVITDEILDQNMGDEIGDYFDTFEESIENAFQSDEAHFYVNDEFALSDKFRFQLGGRASYFRSENKQDETSDDFLLVQPRGAVEYAPNSNFSLTASAEKAQQSVHQLSTAGVGFPTDLWVPASERAKPQTADQFNLTARYQKTDRLKLTSSVYYKEMANLIRYRDGGALPTIEERISYKWQEDIIAGVGNSRGMEAEVEFQSEGLRFDLGYAYSISRRRFSSVDDGEEFPFRFDQTHSLSANVYQKIHPNIWLYLNWQYATGLPQTLFVDSTGYFNPLDAFSVSPSTAITTTNGHQLPNYHRLDLGFQASFRRKQFTHELNLGIQNAYRRRNIYYEYFYEDEFFPEDSESVKSASLPIVPILRYRVLFAAEEKS